MKNENHIIGAKIRLIRESKGYSREKLSEKANISIQFLSDIETGKKGMSVSTLKKLCIALNVTPNTILYDSEYNNEFSLLINDLISSMPKDKQEKLYNILTEISEFSGL